MVAKSEKPKKNSNCTCQTLSKMHSLNLNCATKGELLKSGFENKQGEFTGRVTWRAYTLLEE